MDRYGLICRNIDENSSITQRELALEMDISLGTVNRLVNECAERGLIENCSEPGKYHITAQGLEYLEPYRVDCAVITAAGFGSRFVPLTFETPKGLLEVFGERMIERQIRQLHEAGITDITIVVGYLKEKFEYLIDKYNVKLLYNAEYSTKNTLATIYHARELFRGKNTYLLVSDNWLRENMYHKYECGSWYSAVYMEGETSEWCLSANKKGRITSVSIGGRDAWAMYGPAFLSKSCSQSFIPLIEEYYNRPGTEQFYWEHVIKDQIGSLELYLNCRPEGQVYEFENLEELREFDPKYQNRSDNEAMRLVSQVFHIKESDIRNIRCLKAGMTNQSFLFEVNGAHYICRIPGPGTDRLIDRRQEQDVYRLVEPLGITEQIVYFDGDTGYKIAKYYEGARNSNARDWTDVEACMELLKKLHHANLIADHSFDMRERIHFYETLCKNHQFILFDDYSQVRAWMDVLLDRLDTLKRPQCLSHIDSVADNFLFLPDGSIKLIDWEYAGMQDPLIDIAMCGIYSYYDEAELDRLLTIYLGCAPSDEERLVTYAYSALGGFLWCLWAIFKSIEGEEFGEYTIVMYRYAKQYYKKIIEDGLI
ncbi:MAG: phosphotransferase [Clostridium sp.]